MSRVESYNKSVFLILPDNTALQFQTRQEQRQRIGGSTARRPTIGDMLKSLMPRVARITPYKTVLPSGRVVALASPSPLPQ